MRFPLYPRTIEPKVKSLLGPRIIAPKVQKLVGPRSIKSKVQKVKAQSPNLMAQGP